MDKHLEIHFIEHGELLAIECIKLNATELRRGTSRSQKSPHVILPIQRPEARREQVARDPPIP